MAATDTKFGIVSCAITDVRNILYFQLPQTFTDRNETYNILKSQCGSNKICLRILKFVS